MNIPERLTYTNFAAYGIAYWTAYASTSPSLSSFWLAACAAALHAVTAIPATTLMSFAALKIAKAMPRPRPEDAALVGLHARA